MKFYDIHKLLDTGAQYCIAIGERSNGKSYSALSYAIERLKTSGEKFAYVRRYKEDIRGKRGETIFAGINANGLIAQNFEDYDGIYYRNSRFYLGAMDVDSGKVIRSDEPAGYLFALSDVEHDKSTSYPDVTTIIFDEFTTRQIYLKDEFVLFMNVVSTIIRHRDNVKIIMLGNTVDSYCPYFDEMGLKHIQQQSQGTIDIYKYGNKKDALTVAVEFTGSDIEVRESKPSDKYFAFDNPKLRMITGGEWEFDIYPHCPYRFDPIDVVGCAFVLYKDTCLQMDVVNKSNDIFIFVHKKTTPIQSPDTDLIFQVNPSPKQNVFCGFKYTVFKPVVMIRRLIELNKVFYQNNEIGETLRAYMRDTK